MPSSAADSPLKVLKASAVESLACLLREGLRCGRLGGALELRSSRTEAALPSPTMEARLRRRERPGCSVMMLLFFFFMAGQ